MAREAGLDLVEVSPTVRPPVCRIIDYGKWKYQQKKNQKKTHEQQLKEVRLRPRTDDNDRSIKVNRAIRFFSKGDKVQFTMLFRGRERAHRDIAYAIFNGILEELKAKVKVDRPPSMDGKNMIMVLSPMKGAFDHIVVSEADEKADAAALAAEQAEHHDDDQDDGGDDAPPQANSAPVEIRRPAPPKDSGPPRRGGV